MIRRIVIKGKENSDVSVSACESNLHPGMVNISQDNDIIVMGLDILKEVLASAELIVKERSEQ